MAVWDAKSGKRLGEFDANPLPLAEQIALTKARIAELQAVGAGPSPGLGEAESAVAKLQLELASAKAVAAKAQDDFNAKAGEVVRLKAIAAVPNPPTENDAQLAAARAVREKARVVRSDATNAVESLSGKLSAADAKAGEIRKSRNPAAEITAAQAALVRLTGAQQRRIK